MFKSRAEYMKNYRKKKREEKLKTEKVEPKKIAKSSTQRTREFRARAANSILSQTSTADSIIALSNPVVNSATLQAPSLAFCPTPSTSTATACSTSPTEIHPHPANVKQERVVGEDVEQMENVVHNSTVRQYHNQKSSTAHDKLKTKFLDNNFGAVCNVCGRLWYESDMKSLPPCARELISAEFPDLNFETACICSTCHLALSKNKTPTLSKSHGLKYPSRPLHLPELDLISERLISPRLPFMTTKRLRHENGQYGILGQVINVPVSVYIKEEHRGLTDDTKVSEDAGNYSDVLSETEVGKKEQTKRNMSSDDAYWNAMATGVNIIIARVYNFFKSEYEYLNKNYGEIFDVAPFSQYKERTSEATGFDVDVVSRALEELEIQDGGAKKRKLNVNDSLSCEDSKSDNDEDCKYYIELNATEDDCQPSPQPEPISKPHDYVPPPGPSSAAQITEGFVTYEMQSKPTEKLIIKVEKDDDFEGMQEEEKLKELKRKRNRERQRAYYQRQKDLKKKEIKKGRKKKETAPKSNAERQRKFRQRNAAKSYVAMKRQKLDSNEENVVQCRAVENIQNVTLQKNLFHSQKLQIYDQHNECITPEVTLHRNTGIPSDGNCLFHSLISVLQLQIETCTLRHQLRDSTYLSSCHNPEEAYNILSSTNEYGDLDCLYVFTKMYNQNVCVHYNLSTKNQDTIFIHFKANDKQNWIHLHLREQRFTPFYEVSDLLETIQDATQNEVHVDANIKLLRENYDEDPTEDNLINDENEIEIDREDRIGENIMDFIIDGTVPVYTNYLKHSTSHIDFYKDFTSNSFGHSCIICDRLWWKRDLKMSTSKHERILKTILRNYTPGEMVQVCSTCYTSLEKERIPLMSTYNGFAFPKIPSHLPTLNLIEQRLISPRIPFKQIRRLRHVDGQYGIYGQTINFPVEVNTMVKQLPRNILDDHCLYVHLKKKLIHKTSYVHGLINKNHIKEWLLYLVSTPLFIHHDIKIDESFFTGNEGTSQLDMDEISEHVPIEDNLVALQQTLLWIDDYFSSLAPGEYNRPVSILMDDQIDHAEELSFPTIYGGQFRTYRDGVTVTPFVQATSELRRTDRRATDPQHLLYIAAKIIKLRVRGCVNVALKHVGLGTSITKETIQSEEYINNCLETNLAFLRCIPNSVWFWSDRKKDLFAMIRQLGPPTGFMNLSANETGWDNLLKLLYKLKNEVAEIADEVLAEMSYVHKAQLVNEDAVTCAIYFNKMVNCLLKVLQSKKRSPFGKYRVVHYFGRIEFQHRGSPHAHILLWLENVPDDLLSNDPEVIKFIDELVSVSASEASGNIKLVTHKHTFTCYKKINPNKKQECRFGAPYMPTKKTINLIPMKDTDPDYSEELFKEYNKRFKFIRNNLENYDYTNYDEFYSHNDIISDDHYYDIIRAGINRPKLLYKRTPAEKWHNTFNPFVLHHLKSNMDFQIILDEYTCATYIIEYINKHRRGISNLQRQIINILDEHPEFDIVDITKKMSIDILQSVEMSAQEAAWYLLREPMVKSSVVTVYIPTVLPNERARIRKSMKELEALDDVGTDVPKENWFDKYEKRPEELRDVTLAQFVAKYYLNKKKTYTKRDTARIIRYRNYDMTDNYNDYRREMVLLHVPFNSEENDIIAENKFIQIYEDNKDTILERRKEFETNLDMEKTLEICRQLCRENDEEQEDEELLRAVDILHERDPYGLLPRDPNSTANVDLHNASLLKLGAKVIKRENFMDYQQLFMANDQQRDIHNLQTSIQEPFKKNFYRMFGVSDTNKDPLNTPTDCLENTAIQVSKAVLRDPLKIETDLENAEHSPDDHIVVKEEIDIGDERIG